MSEIARLNPMPDNAPDSAATGSAILRLLDRPIVPAELDVQTALAARSEDARRGQSVRLLLFRIGDEVAALPVRHLRRVTPLARPSPIPNRSGRVVRGLCNIRGEIVLCADLHRLLGLHERAASVTPPDDAGESRRMVVIGSAENSWAFEVDALLGVESADPATFRVPPVTVAYSLADFTMGVTEMSGRCVTILDGERLLAGFGAGLT
jgi:chemotaxis-related protein WspD